MFSVSAILNALMVTLMCSFSIDVSIRTLSDECSLEVFKLAIKVCHSAQDVLPLPIPAKRWKNKTKKKQALSSHIRKTILNALTANKTMHASIIKWMLFWHKCITDKTSSSKCKRRWSVHKPQYTTERSLSPSYEVAVTGNYHLSLFSVVLWNIRRLPVHKQWKCN